MQSKYEQRVAALQQEAAQQVQQYKQQWRTEFDKRRKLHNQVRNWVLCAVLASIIGIPTCRILMKDTCTAKPYVSVLPDHQLMAV